MNKDVETIRAMIGNEYVARTLLAALDAATRRAERAEAGLREALDRWAEHVVEPHSDIERLRTLLADTDDPGAEGGA